MTEDDRDIALMNGVDRVPQDCVKQNFDSFLKPHAAILTSDCSVCVHIQYSQQSMLF